MSPNDELLISVSEFVGLINQSFDYTFPEVTIHGEIANFRVSKGKWVYFDLKDETSSVKFFGTVYQLATPLEDGLTVKVRGTPRLHNLYGFSVNVAAIQPLGEGSIKRAALLLQGKLAKEGLFDDSRKRQLPYPPTKIGLITSAQSAAYADFIKIISARWQGINIELIDVQVQGEAAIEQIVAALAQFNMALDPPDVVVLIRGGGSADDLAAFSTEQVTRAVAGSRIPTLVAIGHEIDVSLAELAADRRASTPSNAAEMLVPDKQQVISRLKEQTSELRRLMHQRLAFAKQEVSDYYPALQEAMHKRLEGEANRLQHYQSLLAAYDPMAVLKRGFAIVSTADGVIQHAAQVKSGQVLHIRMYDGSLDATATHIYKQERKRA